MVLLVFAFNGTALGKPIFFSAAAVVLIGYFIAYGFYTMRVSLGTVLGIETTNEVVHLHTARKTYTYDVRMGCVGVKEHRNRFVAVFRTQDSRDSFTFYKHAPLLVLLGRAVLFGRYFPLFFRSSRRRAGIIYNYSRIFAYCRVDMQK